MINEREFEEWSPKVGKGTTQERAHADYHYWHSLDLNDNDPLVKMLEDQCTCGLVGESVAL